MSTGKYLPTFRRIVLSSKDRYVFSSRHGAISQKTCISNRTALEDLTPPIASMFFRDRSHINGWTRAGTGTYDVHQSSVRAVVTYTFWGIHTGACISPFLDKLHHTFYSNVVLNPGCRKCGSILTFSSYTSLQFNVTV